MEIKDFQEMGKKIEEYLRPATYPLAIKLIKHKEEIPEGHKKPEEDLELEAFICQNFAGVWRDPTST